MQVRKALVIALVVLATSAFLLPLSTFAGSWSAPFALGSGNVKPSVAIAPDGSVHYIWYNGDIIQYVKCTGLNKASCGNVENLPDKGQNYYPSIAVDSSNRPHAVWEAKDGTTSVYSIYYSKRTSSWSSPKRISTESYAELPDVAVGGDDSVHIIYQSKSGQDGSVYYSKSGNNGASFESPELLDQVQTEKELPVLAEKGLFGNEGKNAEGQAPEGTKLSAGFYPRIDADADGLAHAVWQKPASGYGIGYRYQTGPTTWSATKSFGTGGTKSQTPDVAVNGQGDVGIVWTMYEGGDISFAEFSNGSTDYNEDDVDGGLQDSFWPKVDADCEGTFHLAYQGRPDTSDWEIYHNTYDPNTNDFGQRTTIASITASEQTPSIAVTNVAAIVYTNSTNNIIDASTNNLGLNCTNETPTPSNTPTFTNTPDPNQTATNTPTPPAGKVRVNDSSNQIVYSGTWKVAKNTPTCLYKNDFHYAEPNSGNKAKLEFNGTKVKVWFVASATMGTVQILIDDTVVGTKNLNASTAACKAFTSDDLPYGTHTVEIRPKGTAGRISLDVITVYP